MGWHHGQLMVVFVVSYHEYLEPACFFCFFVLFVLFVCFFFVCLFFCLLKHFYHAAANKGAICRSLSSKDWPQVLICEICQRCLRITAANVAVTAQLFPIVVVWFLWYCMGTGPLDMYYCHCDK